MRYREALVPFVAALVLVGCAQTQVRVRGEGAVPRGGGRVLLLPPDLELYRLTAGGLLEPCAEWTESAQRYVRDALADFLRKRGLTAVTYAEPAGDPLALHRHSQALKLHEAVGNMILVHEYQQRLPSKEGRFAWTLGESATRLGEDGEYALFVYLRDSYSTGGRVALMVAAALLQISLPGGQQVGFASLVDLGTGDVVWFNTLLSTTGDLRTVEEACAATAQLMEGFPL